MHDWQEDHNAPFHHPRNTPWWKCAKCGTLAQSWDKPPDDIGVKVLNNTLTCEEYLAFQVMEA